MKLNVKIFVDSNRAYVDFYNYIMGNDVYDYDNQSIEYHHLQTLLNEHFPNKAVHFNFILTYFINRGVLIGFCPISTDDTWTARALSNVKSVICDDLKGGMEAQEKCIEYGFQVLNEILLLTKEQNKIS